MNNDILYQNENVNFINEPDDSEFEEWNIENASEFDSKRPLLKCFDMGTSMNSLNKTIRRNRGHL